jgi:predicted MFS family arabinose efflux permease
MRESIQASTNENRNYWLYIFSIIFSSAAHYLLTISILTHFVFAQSVQKTTLSLAITWVPSTILLIVGGQFFARTNPCRGWFFMELLSSLSALCIAVSLSASAQICIFVSLFAKSAFDFITRVLRVAAIQQLFCEEKRAELTSLSQVCFYSGYAVAGLTGTFALAHLRPMAIAGGCSIILLISAIMIALMQPNGRLAYQTQGARKIFFNFDEISKSFDGFWATFMLLLICSVFFQGTFSVVQNLIPIQNYRLGKSSLGFVHFLMGSAILLGSISYNQARKKYSLLTSVPFENSLPLLIAVSLTAILFWISAIPTTPILAGIAYFLFIFIFEFLFMWLFVSLITNSKPTCQSDVLAFTHASCSLAQAGFALCLGFILETRSPAEIVAFSIFCVLGFTAFIVNYRRRIQQI